MGMSQWQRSIDRAFDRPVLSQDETRWYLDKLIAQWAESEKAFTKTAATSVLSSALFVLLTSRAVTEINLGLARIASLQVLQVGLSVFIAYLYYSLGTLYLNLFRSRIVFERVIRKRYPTLALSDCHTRLYPNSALVLDQLKLIGPSGSTPWALRVLAATLVDLRAGGVATALPVFLVYTQWQIFEAPGYFWLKIIGLALVAYWVGTGFLTIVIAMLPAFGQLKRVALKAWAALKAWRRRTAPRA